MYEFIDTTETSEGVSLPSEALKINGEYIENLITGYRTLTVEGREALSPEISDYETGIRDGSTLKGKRYPARIIRITYQLIAASCEAFREAYNKLGSILDVTDAQLIFNDETDKFFTGTPCLIEEVPPGRNSVVAAFEFLCLDPFKYSVMEYEASADPGETSVVLDYKGTYKGFPTLQAEFFKEDEASEDGETAVALTGNGDCGYVAFFNEDEKIIQIGDPDEADGENAYAKSQTLINQNFNASTSWGSAAKANWKVNSGITSSSAVEQKGTPGMAVSKYAAAETDYPEKQQVILTATSKAARPYIHYTVSAKVYERTASTAKVSIIVGTRLDNSDSYFGSPYGLTGWIYIGGAWKSLKLKGSDEFWRGTSIHSRTMSVTITGLTSAQSKIGSIKFKATRDDNTLGTSGVLSETNCSDVNVGTYTPASPEEYYLTSTSFGTGSNWHGASITRTIPADASGEVGAKNFTLTYKQKMCIGTGSNATSELGAFQVLLVSGSGTSRKIVAGVNVFKGENGKRAKLRFYVNNSVKHTMYIDLSYLNQYFGHYIYNGGTKACEITKFGSQVTFNIAGVLKSFTDAAIADTAVNEVTFTFSQFGTKPTLSYNGLLWAKFVKNNCNRWKDIQNKFSTNDVVEADCKSGEIILNGVPAPALGALGNDWEGFYLTPGVNQIGFAYSEWVDAAYAPTFKVKYREVFI